ncbi:MAG: hypothetical protein H7Y17_13655 [Chlorobia bacterium]|nr:hypothetical protein [Fimbriimonadaceae bacterium]
MGLALLLTLYSSQVRSKEDAAAPAKGPDIRVLLAVPEGHGTTKSPLHVIIQNLTDKPQSHFEEWNSWGYGNLTVEWTDTEGKTGTVKKVPGGWDRNGPSTIALPPSEALVREISFDPKLWDGWPDLPYGSRLTLKVIYQCVPAPKAPAWSGKVASKEQSVLFR